MYDSNYNPFYDNGNYNGYGTNMSNTSFGYWTSQYYQPYIYDRINLNNSWYRPRNIIYNIYSEKEKNFAARKLSKRCECYNIIERNGREVEIGKLKLKEKFIVNLKPDQTFDALYCNVECDGNEHQMPISIPYKDFIKRNILLYLPFFHRNEDCPDKYIVMAFFQELCEGDDIKFLQLPQYSGWQEKSAENKTLFASSDSVIPQLRMYYSEDILERKLVHTEKKLADAAEALTKLLPNSWKYKFLLSIRITSLLLYFYKLAGLTPDHMFIVEPKSESNAKAAIALLKNKNSTNSCHQITDSRTNLQHELNTINDGIALFRDSSYIEDHKKRNIGLDILLQDLNNCNGSEIRSRHLTVILSDNPGNISSEFPAYFISLNDCPNIDNIEELRQVVCEFDSALIHILSNSEVTENLVTNGLKRMGSVQKTIKKSEYYMSLHMLNTTICILCNYNVISYNDLIEIHSYLKNGMYEIFDTDQSITNEFRQILSSYIEHNSLYIAKQIGPPYFDPEKSMVFIDNNHINITAKTLDMRILISMKTTKKRNKLLSALKACGKLYSNNNYKRRLDVEVAPGIMKTVNVYSFPKDILSEKCREKINAIDYADNIFEKSHFPKKFLPIAYINDVKKAVGRVVNDSTDEAESIYVSGQTRSGKTNFLVEQSVIRFESGNKVIIFDQAGSFSCDELRKHLPSEIVEKYFSHWDISKYGVPIDLMSLENCLSLPNKKIRLFSIFAVAARITGDIQGKVLKKRLSDISRAIDAGRIHSLPETLEFFDNEDPDQAKLKDRLEEVFDDLEGLNNYEQNWESFLSSQKKIVVLSTSADGIRKNSQIIDMMLASLYEYKQYNRTQHYTIILDEIEDLCLEKEGPISTILRKGAKHNLSLLLASQEFSIEKDNLGKLVGNCGILVFFRPKDANLRDIAKHIGVDKAALATLEQGQCMIHGPLYNKQEGRNKTVTIKGRTYRNHE